MIDFKTYDEQLEILKSRGLIIENDTQVKEILRTNNYYNIINAYKDIFIKKGTTPEKYIDGANFNEIFAVFKFDKRLRLCLSHRLIIVERTIKSIIAYEFSKNHPNHDSDYLNIDNYDTTVLINEDGKPAVVAASEVIRYLNDELIKSLDKQDKMICHYKNKYNHIPLWVFINKLTFGNVSKMYNVFKSSDRDHIAKSIGELSNQKLFFNEIRNAIKILVYLRNKTAHDQRIYDFSSQTTTVSNNNRILKSYGLKNVNTLFGAIACFSLFMPQDEYKSFTKEIKNVIKELFVSVHSIPTQIILDKMGIPQSFLK